MHRVYYKPGIGGEPICLEGDGVFAGYGGGLRSRRWTRAVSGKGVYGTSIGIREVDFDVLAFDDQADALRRACDADIESMKPGTICVDGEWNMRCYIVESSTTDAFRDHVALRMKALLLDGFWWKEVTQYFPSGLDESGLNYEHNYDHNYGHSSGKAYVTVDSLIGALPKLTVYGPIANPAVTIGGNRYEVDQSVNSGYSLVLDATGDQKTAILYDPYGNAESVFDKAVRTGGMGGGSYAFEPLPHGQLQVTWSGAFAFELAWRERETEPPWAR